MRIPQLRTITLPVFLTLVLIAEYAIIPSAFTLAQSNRKSNILEVLNDKGSWVNSTRGIRATEITPGIGASTSIYLRNATDKPLVVRLIVTDRRINSTGIDSLDSVIVKVTGEQCQQTVSATLMKLSSGDSLQLPCSPLDAGVQGDPRSVARSGNYTLSLDIKPDSDMKAQVRINNFDLKFEGKPL
ncbi:hypothetical protein IPL85_04545 [Candidatus Saccharibacteria bacterium]|nr:MAG: hypothetical protein IPL85_04545 [Candidatus Saccharibacteria bacterium]